MATVTGMTAEKIIELVDDSLISVAIDEVTGVMTLQTRGGQTLTAGNVDLSKKAVDLAYPVGSLFLSTIATDPATQLGVGTWVAFGTGKTLVGVDPADVDFNAPSKTGGAKTHTLGATEVPRHSHSIDHDHPPTSTNAFSNLPQGAYRTVPTDPAVDEVMGYQTAQVISLSVDIPYLSGWSGNAFGNAQGGTDAHNNMPPYITCYIWKRTA